MQRLHVPPPVAGNARSALAADAGGAGRPAGSSRLLRCGGGGGRGHVRVALAGGVHHLHRGDRPADHRHDRSAPAGGAGRDLGSATSGGAASTRWEPSSKTSTPPWTSQPGAARGPLRTAAFALISASSALGASAVACTTPV